MGEDGGLRRHERTGGHWGGLGTSGVTTRGKQPEGMETTGSGGDHNRKWWRPQPEVVQGATGSSGGAISPRPPRCRRRRRRRLRRPRLPSALLRGWRRRRRRRSPAAPGQRRVQRGAAPSAAASDSDSGSGSGRAAALPRAVRGGAVRYGVGRSVRLAVSREGCSTGRAGPPAFYRPPLSARSIRPHPAPI